MSTLAKSTSVTFKVTSYLTVGDYCGELQLAVGTQVRHSHIGYYLKETERYGCYRLGRKISLRIDRKELLLRDPGVLFGIGNEGPGCLIGVPDATTCARLNLQTCPKIGFRKRIISEAYA
jgi:hypothetical protein